MVVTLLVQHKFTIGEKYLAHKAMAEVQRGDFVVVKCSLSFVLDNVHSLDISQVYILKVGMRL